MRYCLHPLEQQLPEGELKKVAAEVIVDTNKISALLGKMFVNPNLFSKFQESLSNVILDIWKPSETFSCGEAVETISILIYDLQAELEEFLDDPENLELKNLWDDISVSLDSILNEWNEPKRYNNSEEEVNGPLERLRVVIFPEEKEKYEKPFMLFLVNDKIWVVARSKKEVREEVKKEFGLIDLNITSIRNTEVMENGMKTSDMIALANGKTKIVGRTE